MSADGMRCIFGQTENVKRGHAIAMYASWKEQQILHLLTTKTDGPFINDI